MKTDIWELRRALVQTGQINRRERAEIRYLSRGSHEQRVAVMKALGDGHPLKIKMHRCGDVDEWNNVHYCGVPLCPRCFMRERKVQTRQAIRETFAGVENDQLALVTVLLPVVTSLSNVSKLIEKEKRRLNNFVRRQQRKDARWDDFLLVGWWEMDRMRASDFEESGRNTQLALQALEFPLFAYDDTTVWRPHLHAIIRVGELKADEVAKALRNDGHTAPYQVDVRPFDKERPVNRNLQSVVRYCLKFRIENDYKELSFDDEISSGDAVEMKQRAWWPDKDITAYAEWLCQERSGFQSMRFVLGRKKAATSRQVDFTGDVHKPSFDESPAVPSSDFHVIEDVSVFEATNEGISVSDREISWYCSERRVRGKNPILDTNWTYGITNKGGALDLHPAAAPMLHDTKTASVHPPTHAVMSFKDRVHDVLCPSSK